MFSRRNFLINSSLLAASGTALCSPAPAAAAAPASASNATASVADTTAQNYIRSRREWLKDHDPRVFLGYPANMNKPSEGFFRWREQLESVEVGARTMNNVGDPFYHPGALNTHYLEADLIRRFGLRYGFPEDDNWGFVSNRGTDSNTHGAFVGRTLLESRTGVTPKVYYTKEAHYSIQVIRDLLDMEEVLVATTATGAMDPADLREKLKENRDAPVLILATIGTTMKGAVDDIDDINAAVKGYDSYIHLDAALFGGYLHVTDYAEDLYKIGKTGKRYDSIAVSLSLIHISEPTRH